MIRQEPTNFRNRLGNKLDHSDTCTERSYNINRPSGMHSRGRMLA